MGTRHVRQTCEAKLRTLTVPEPFTLHAFCNRLATDRDRPLHLKALPTATAAPCGMWVSTTTADHVFYQVATSPLHQEHIILHELAHMIFGHVSLRDPATDLRERILPSLDPDVVATVLARTSYTSEQEQEAETLADLIGARAQRRTQPPPGADHTYTQALDVFGPEP